jgi:hypothetical protein
MSRSVCPAGCTRQSQKQGKLTAVKCADVVALAAGDVDVGQAVRGLSVLALTGERPSRNACGVIAHNASASIAPGQYGCSGFKPEQLCVRAECVLAPACVLKLHVTLRPEARVEVWLERRHCTQETHEQGLTRRHTSAQPPT